ncbi:N-acetylmuramoyl-L-alanine amidase [Sphingobacterium paramultivorum]|uniref:N-acetylmuramoyl-L-alanine amidase n=1 Tax=Sphingobacterium paramultivorum TaxID=2886510 RepID=UPI00129C595B|nr:N-acetylmuramoyl-L-alanine amidase [Sphingobacterium paramultivorum]
MQVKNNLLYNNDGTQVEFRQSPNVSSGNKDIRFILLHFDAASNSTSAVNWLTQKASGVSADLHIARDGKVTQMAKFNQITWHAGRSEWNGFTNLNRYAIGIEQENMGMVKGVYQDWTEVQIQKCIEVCKALVKAYPTITDILGHEEVATPFGRKDDPGPKFPMDRVRLEVFGVVTKITASDLNLRSGPGTNHSVISVLKKGTPVNVISRSATWSEVSVNGLKGWVSNQYLK